MEIRKIEIKNKRFKFIISISSLRLSFFILFPFILIFLPIEIFAVEGVDVNITYPLTSPRELFSEIEDWKYVRSGPHIFSPTFEFTGETNRELNTNLELNSGFSYHNIRQTIEAGRRQLSIYDSIKTDYLKSSFHYKDDSLFLRYKNSSWFDVRKEIFSFASYLTTEGKDYIGEISTSFNHFDKRNDYTISSRFHRLYGYENMLSIGLTYSHSSYLVDREKILQVNIKDRFAYEDYLFIIPGIKAEFISQILFTPVIQTIYLINKNISLEANIDGKSYETNVKSPYNLPYISFPESLETPLNIIKGSIKVDVMVNNSFLMKINMCARKTKYPIVAIEKENHTLSYVNMDTSITFTSLLADIKVSKGIITINSNFSFGYTPFYKERVPYFPRYKLSMDIVLHPFKPISFVNNIQYIGRIYDSEGKEIEPYYIVSSSFALRIMKNASLNVGALNINDNRERFIADVHFPGRILKTGIKIFF